MSQFGCCNWTPLLILASLFPKNILNRKKFRWGEQMRSVRLIACVCWLNLQIKLPSYCGRHSLPNRSFHHKYSKFLSPSFRTHVLVVLFHSLPHFCHYWHIIATDRWCCRRVEHTFFATEYQATHKYSLIVWRHFTVTNGVFCKYVNHSIATSQCSIHKDETDTPFVMVCIAR